VKTAKNRRILSILGLFYHIYGDEPDFGLNLRPIRAIF